MTIVFSRYYLSGTENWTVTLYSLGVNLITHPEWSCIQLLLYQSRTHEGLELTRTKGESPSVTEFACMDAVITSAASQGITLFLLEPTVSCQSLHIKSSWSCLRLLMLSPWSCQSQLSPVSVHTYTNHDLRQDSRWIIRLVRQVSLIAIPIVISESFMSGLNLDSFPSIVFQ